MSSYLNKLNAQIREEDLKQLLSNIEKPVIRLQNDEVCEGREHLETLECIICKHIVIEPLECNKCDVIFCEECLKVHQKTTHQRNASKCPQCKQEFDKRPMNRKLFQMTINKLKFKHSCKKRDNDLSKLTPFERFKLTDQYQKILKQQNKSTSLNLIDNQENSNINGDENNQTQNAVISEVNLNSQNEDDAEQPKSGKKNTRASKRLQKQNDKDKLDLEKKKKDEELKRKQAEDSLYQQKEYTYEAYIRHLKNDCHSFKTHQCKLECGVEDKFNYRELKEHYENVCKQMPVECRHCKVSKPRKDFKTRHLPKTCIKNLLDEKDRKQQLIDELVEQKNNLMNIPGQDRDRDGNYAGRGAGLFGATSNIGLSANPPRNPFSYQVERQRIREAGERRGRERREQNPFQLGSMENPFLNVNPSIQFGGQRRNEDRVIPPAEPRFPIGRGAGLFGMNRGRVERNTFIRSDSDEDSIAAFRFDEQ